MVDKHNKIWTLQGVADAHNQGNKEVFEGSDDLDRYPYFLHFGRALLRAAKGRNDAMTVLDVGCGAGWFGVYLRRKGLLDRFAYSGIDASEAMCQLARENFPEGSFAAKDLFLFETNRRWDIVSACGVLESVPDWRRFLERLVRLSGEWVLLHKFFMTGQAERIETREAYGEPIIRVVMNKQEVEDEVERLGFSVVRPYSWGANIHSLLLRRK